MATWGDHGITVSVIVPAWNVAPWLGECLASVEAQTLGVERLELIAVDDGSTDGTEHALDLFAEHRPWVRVIHQPNSGGPGAPRNAGIDVARGRYIHFLDADDYLAPDALERMLELAERNGSDIVIGRIVGVEGRATPDGVRLARTIDRADLSVYSGSANVLKLFRAGFIREAGVRFAAGVGLGEDGDFMGRLAPGARVVSILGGAPTYFSRRRAGSQTMVGAPRSELMGWAARIEECRILPLAERVPPGRRREQLLRQMLMRVADRFEERWMALGPEDRAMAFGSAAGVMQRWGTPWIVASLPPRTRIRAWCLQQGLQRAMEDVATARVDVVFNSPHVEAGRIFAAYPHFRDPLKIPDDVFDITDRVWLEASVQRAGVHGTRVVLAGTAHLTTVSGRPRVALRRWPVGPTLEAAVVVTPTPGLRDSCRAYPQAGYVVDADIGGLDHGSPLDPGTWEILLGAEVPGVVRWKPAIAPRGWSPVDAGPAPASSSCRLVRLRDGRLRLRVGRSGVLERLTVMLEVGGIGLAGARGRAVAAVVSLVQRFGAGQALLMRLGMRYRRLAQELHEG